MAIDDSNMNISGFITSLLLLFIAHKHKATGTKRKKLKESKYSNSFSTG